MTKFISVEDISQKEKKETMLTHIFKPDSGWVCYNRHGFKLSALDMYEKVIYLGKCSIDGDMFACYLDGVITIYKGVKGDEFND